MPRTIDEVLAEIEQIAFSAEAGADKMRALKILKDQQASSVFLPDPTSASEAVDRLARLLRAQGRDRARLAWQRAFPTSRIQIDELYRPADVELSAEEHDTIERIFTVKQFWTVFPEMRNPTGGMPKGMPRSSALLRRTWLQDQAVRLMKARKIAANAIERRTAAAERQLAEPPLQGPDPQEEAADLASD